jgi:hypothetical protein
VRIRTCARRVSDFCEHDCPASRPPCRCAGPALPHSPLQLPAVGSVAVRRRSERTTGEWCAQDIAVDGWAITMLSKRNVGLASTANAVGQTAGLVISFTGYLVLNSWGLVGLGGFLRFWGAVFLVSAGLVLFTFEKPSTQRISVVDAYAQVTRQLALDAQRTGTVVAAGGEGGQPFAGVGEVRGGEGQVHCAGVRVGVSDALHNVCKRANEQRAFEASAQVNTLLKTESVARATVQVDNDNARRTGMDQSQGS